jgi:hypothetical protein
LWHASPLSFIFAPLANFNAGPNSIEKATHPSTYIYIPSSKKLVWSSNSCAKHWKPAVGLPEQIRQNCYDALLGNGESHDGMYRHSMCLDDDEQAM